MARPDPHAPPHPLDAIGVVERLKLKPGDTLVLKLAEELTTTDRHVLAGRLRRAFPDATRIAILDRGMDLVVLEATDGA